MGLPAIRVEGLGKRYRLVHGQERVAYKTMRDSLASFVANPFKRKGSVEEFWALSDVSFEVQPGEVLGVIGRNGAGKSTLLKVLSRITKPTTGRVEINGRVGSLLEVGTGFHPELTGRENIYLNGSILGMSWAEIAKKFDEIVAFAEVAKFLDTPVKRYSSGMYVRLAFAVAAHLEPEILVVDEVLAVGDAEFQKKCLGKINEVAKGGRTVLFVSHNMGAVGMLCTQGLMLHAGQVSFVGPISTAIDTYNNASKFQSHIYTRGATQPTPHFTRIQVSQAGRDGPPFRIDQPITICFEFDPLGHPGLQVGTRIRNGQGVTVVHSTDEFLATDLSPKSHARVCVLPPYALAAGTYYLRGGLFVRNGDSYQALDDVVSFTVEFTGHMADRSTGFQWKGVTGPGLVRWAEHSEGGFVSGE